MNEPEDTLEENIDYGAVSDYLEEEVWHEGVPYYPIS
jgi:hypothetical protein